MVLQVLGKLLCTDPHPACVESVQFCPLEGQSDVAACVTTSGDLSIWGISRQEVRDAAILSNEVTKIAWSKTDRGLIMATVLGDIEVYDGLNVCKEPKKLLGHSATVLDLCQSP
jgi:WD40 repeat protein